MQDMRRNFSPKFSRDFYGDAMLVPIRMGTNMAAWNQQKHLSLSFASKAQNDLSLEELKNDVNNTFSYARTVQIAKFPEIMSK